MQALVETFTLSGIEALPVEVQVSVDNGYPTTTIVGLPDKAVRESLDRIYAAFHSSGFTTPDRRVTVNLAPAELRKEGSAFDLPIALGILAALGAMPAGDLLGLPVAGELALNGEIRAVRGALAMALSAGRQGRGRLLLPAANLAEASNVPGVSVAPVRGLLEAVDRIRGRQLDAGDQAVTQGEPQDPTAPSGGSVQQTQSDLDEIRGQAAAKRALEVAAAGGHNLLLSGPPGTGKTLLAQRLPGILPPLSPEESLEVTLIHSVAGLLRPGIGRIWARPFRAPHHTVTGPGLVGGGAIPRPGEVSLAHCGVLFLDEMPEFRPQVLNLLRQPLEEGRLQLVRAGRAVTFPCRSMLVGAMNSCPCGFLGHPRKPCKCTPHQIRLYKGRVGGPLLDRIDLHVEVPPVSARELMRGMGRGQRGRDPHLESQATAAGSTVATPEATEKGHPPLGARDTSILVRRRVEEARRVQAARFESRPGIHCNAQMGLAEINTWCRLDDAAGALLQKAIESLSMSARAAHRSLRVARTIADLAGAAEIGLEHVAEAVQYQAMERASGS